MASVTFEGQHIELRPGETVLDACVRMGARVSYSCRAGVCQSCLMRVEAGPVPGGAQNGLKESLRADDLILSCLARPESDVVIARPREGLGIDALVESMEELGAGISRVRLRALGPFLYRAGQYVNFVRRDGLTRSYSVASVSELDPWIDLHVRLVDDGEMSAWVHGELRPDDLVELRGPSGSCVYLPGDPDAPLVLVGAGAGVGTAFAIAREALLRGHRGPVHFFQAAPTAGLCYFESEISHLRDVTHGFGYVRCLAEGEPAPGAHVGRIEDAIVAAVPHLATVRAFLCGDADAVNPVRRKLLLRGASQSRIHAEPFLTRKP